MQFESFDLFSGRIPNILSVNMGSRMICLNPSLAGGGDCSIKEIKKACNSALKGMCWSLIMEKSSFECFKLLSVSANGYVIQ